MGTKDSSNLMNITMQALLRNTRDFAFVKDKNFIYVGASEAFAIDCVGCSGTHELIGKSDFEIFSDQSLAAKYRKDDEKILNSGLPMIEYREAYPDKKSRKRYCLTTKYIILDEEGNPAGIFGQCHDITEQVELEQIGKMQQLLLDRQKNIFKSLRDVYSNIIFLDFLKEKYVYVTESDKVIGNVKSAGSLLEDSPFWMFNDMTLEVTEASKDFFDLSTMSERMTNKGTITREIKCGHYGWFRVSLIPVEYDKNGNVISGLLVDEQIDEEVRMRGELENRVAILDALYGIYNACMFWNLKDDTYFFVSGKEYGSKSIVPKKGVLSKAIVEWVDSDLDKQDKEECMKAADLKMLADKLKRDGIIVKEIHSKSSGWERTSLIPVNYDNEGNVISCLWVGESINKEKKKDIEQREALKEAYETAKRANSAKTEFLSRVSHDIRTPMNAIIGMTSIALAYLDDKERVKDCLDKITYSSRHLMTLINEVLDMSKIESGNIEINEESFNIIEMIESVTTIVKSLVNEKEHEFVVKMNDISHENLIGDKLHIQQIITNIMSNAIKYTPNGGNIKLTVEELPSRQPLIATYVFTFEDNGIGMSKEYLKHIYEPFSREEDSRTNKISGTGLGMSIVMNIIKLLGGEIKIESKKGEGSKFVVTIHLKIQNKESLSTEKLSGKSVLVVDDDKFLCESVCIMLNEIGMNGEWTQTGSGAIDKIVLAHNNRQDYFAVVLDWKMEGMNGVETAKNIRKLIGPSVPIIILSAYDWSEIEIEARQAGVNEFLAKPIVKASVINLFNQLIEREENEKKDNSAKQLLKYKYSGSRVLVVEDQQINMEIAKTFLNMTGVTVESAENGLKAVNMVDNSEEGYYDLIFMDVQMPVMNGYDATRAIRLLPREDVKDMPIVAMTANAFLSDVNDAKKAGMNDHISKPIDLPKFIKVMNEWLGSCKIPIDTL